MFELIETNPPVAVPEAEYQRLLGYPKHRPLEGRARELAEAAQGWFAENGRPWFCAREITPVKTRSGKTWLGGTEFSSRRLAEMFSEASVYSALLVAVSAGRECEEQARRLWEEGKPDEYFFLESFGSAVVEQLVALVSGRLCQWADEQQAAVLPHCSPGYAGWDIAEQIPLGKLFRQNFSGGVPGELEVLDSGMLRPKKSLLAVFGLTRDLVKARAFARLIPCQDCPLPNCQYRRASYRRSRLPLENVSGAAPG